MSIVKSVKSVEWHRNGVSGQAFYVVLFVGIDGDGKERNMVATLFPGDNDDYDDLRVRTPRCAVFDVDLLAAGDIGGDNQWRGDCFETELRPLVRKHFNCK